MSRLLWTRVHVSVIFWDEIHVVENKALERVLLQRLDERDVHDSRLVERVLAVLSAKHISSEQTTSVA